MKHHRVVVALLMGSLVAVLSAGAWAQGAQAEEKPQATPATNTKEAPTKTQKICPLMGGEVDRSLYVDYNGKRIFVCCTECLPEVKKDPARILEVMKEKGIDVEDTPNPQRTCPITGKPIDRRLFVDYEGKRIFLCCPACVGPVKGDPAKYVKELRAKGIQLEDTPTPAKRPKTKSQDHPHGHDHPQ